MTKAEAIQLFGSKKALAEALGVHRSLISKLPDQLPTKYSDRWMPVPNGWNEKLSH